VLANRAGETRWVLGSGSWLKSESLVEVPGDGNFTVGLGGDGSEGTYRQIDGVVGVTGWADISNSDGNLFTIVRVGDGDTPAAVLRLLAKISVPSHVNGSNQVIVAVDGTAGTSVSALVEVGGKSVSNIATGAAGVAASVISRASVVVGTRVVSRTRVIVGTGIVVGTRGVWGRLRVISRGGGRSLLVVGGRSVGLVGVIICGIIGRRGRWGGGDRRGGGRE